MLRAAVNENIASINLCYVLSNLNLYKTDKNLHLPFFFFFFADGGVCMLACSR